MSEVKEGSGDGWEIPDEAMVEVNEAYESLHVSLVLRGEPIMDSSDFHRVHLDLVFWDDQFKVLNLLSIELTLLRVEK